MAEEEGLALLNGGLGAADVLGGENALQTCMAPGRGAGSAPEARGIQEAVLSFRQTLKHWCLQSVWSLCARRCANRRKYSPSSVRAWFVQVAKLLSALKNLSVTIVYSQECVSGHFWGFKVAYMYYFWKTNFCAVFKVDLHHSNYLYWLRFDQITLRSFVMVFIVNNNNKKKATQNRRLFKYMTLSKMS